MFMRYGEILKCDEYLDTISNEYITIKVAKIDDTVALFICINGEVVNMRYVIEQA